MEQDDVTGMCHHRITESLVNLFKHISCTCNSHYSIKTTSQNTAYCDDQKDGVTLRLLILLHRGILHGLIQDGGEVGGTMELHIV